MNIFACTSEQVTQERNVIIAGIDTRIVLESTIKSAGSEALLAIVGTLAAHKKRVARLDGMTLAFVHHNPLLRAVSDDGAEHTAITYADMFTSQRRAGQCFNEKAIPKVFTIARVLNGGVFNVSGNDDETCAGIVLALGKGITSGKLLKNYLCDYMNTPGKGRGTWHSQDTQGSSTLRALEALGVVARVDGKGTTWKIVSEARFVRLLDGAHGIPYVAPLPVETPASAADIGTLAPVVGCDSDSVNIPTPDTLAEALAVITAEDAARESAIKAIALPAYDAQALLAAPVETAPQTPAKRARAPRKSK